MLCRRYETQQEKVLPFPLEDNTMCVPDMFEDDEDKVVCELIIKLVLTTFSSLGIFLQKAEN